MKIWRYIVACTILLVATTQLGVASPRRTIMPVNPEYAPDTLNRSYRHIEAVKYYTQHDYERATKIWQRLIEEDSTFSPALYYMSIVAEGDAAREYAYKAYNADSTNKWYAQNLGARLITDGRYHEALPIFRRLTQLDKNNAHPYCSLAILYSMHEMPYSAIATIDTAEMRMGRNPILSEMKMELLVGVGNYDKAIEEGLRIIEESPYDVAAHVRLAQAYEISGKDSLALATYKQACSLDETDIDAISAIVEYYRRTGDITNMLGYETRLFADKRIELDEKITRLERYMLNYDIYGAHFFRIGSIIAQLAIDYPNDRRVIKTYATHLIAGGNNDDALEYMRHHLDDAEATAEEHMTVMQYEHLLGEEALLAEDLNRSLERFPNDIDILSFSGFVASERGDMKEAVAIFRQALKNATTDEDRSMLWGYIGDMYHEQGLSNKCFKAYDKALRFNPNNILVLNNYAYFLCLANKDLNRALLMAEQVVEEQSGNYTYLDTYAWVLHCLGRDREAKSIMQQALSLSSQRDPDLLAHYGDILWSLGERYVAESYWDKAVKQGYDTVKMEEHRKRLKEESEDAVMK